MKILIVYDTVYGNTETIARAIDENLSDTHAVETKLINEVIAEDLKTNDLVIMGSPTHGGWYTDNFRTFFERLPEGCLNNVKVMTYDTSTPTDDNRSLYNKLTKMFGNASVRLGKKLASLRAQVIDTRIFIVEDAEGPLRKNEIEHAIQWIHEHL